LSREPVCPCPPGSGVPSPWLSALTWPCPSCALGLGTMPAVALVTAGPPCLTPQLGGTQTSLPVACRSSSLAEPSPTGHLFAVFVSCLVFEAGSHCAPQAGLELEILLPQPPECWGHRCGRHTRPPWHLSRVQACIAPGVLVPSERSGGPGHLPPSEDGSPCMGPWWICVHGATRPLVDAAWPSHAAESWLALWGSDPCRPRAS
jgi:hypothetical protein